VVSQIANLLQILKIVRRLSARGRQKKNLDHNRTATLCYRYLHIRGYDALRVTSSHEIFCYRDILMSHCESYTKLIVLGDAGCNHQSWLSSVHVAYVFNHISVYSIGSDCTAKC
jgi:hypothetical protein